MKCPLCEHSRSTRFATYADFAVDECGECGFRYVDTDAPGYPSDAQLKCDAEEVLGVPRPDLPHIQRRLRDVLAHIEPPGRCLDIGCGNGEVSLALRVAGFEATGVDMNKRRIAHLNATHPEVEWKCERVEDLVRSQERFDVITMFHVFEHLSQPQQALAEVCKLANPGGLIVIEVPNVGGMEARLKGRSWHYYKVDHVGYFKPRHLVGAMTSCGLKLLDVRGYQHFSFPQNHAIKDAVKSALAALNFKDVICAIAVKPC